MGSAQKWAPRSLAHLLSSGVLSELQAATALASHLSLQEAGPLSQLDLMSSRPGTMCCSPGHPPSSAQQIGALCSQGEGGASGLPWKAGKFALYKQTQFRRPPLTLCPGMAASLQRKGPFFLPTKALSAQPSPWGLRLPKGGFFRVSPKAPCTLSRPWQSHLAQLQAALDGSALRTPDPGGWVFPSIL